MKRFRITRMNWDFSQTPIGARRTEMKVNPHPLIREHPHPVIVKATAELRGKTISLDVVFSVTNNLPGACTLLRAYKEAFADIKGASFDSLEGEAGQSLRYFKLSIKTTSTKFKSTLRAAMELFTTLLRKLGIAQPDEVPAPVIGEVTVVIVRGKEVPLGEFLAQEYYRGPRKRARAIA